MIVIASAFRNASAYIPTYVAQVTALAPHLGPARLLLVHGDSTDDTEAMLKGAAWPLPCDLFACHHGGPAYGSVDTVARWTQIATVWNALLERLRPDDDTFVLIESDLVWEPEALLCAIGRLGPGLDGCAGMTWFAGRFYETWGTRSGGVHFQEYPPYHPAWTGGLMPIDSAGSLMAVKAKYARAARFTNEDGIVGWCNGMRAAGAKLWLDPGVTLIHPPYEALAPRG